MTLTRAITQLMATPNKFPVSRPELMQNSMRAGGPFPLFLKWIRNLLKPWFHHNYTTCIGTTHYPQCITTR